MKHLSIVIISLSLFFVSCSNKQQSDNLDKEQENNIVPFDWEGANIYFLLTDRFNNGDKSNDVNFDRNKETAVLRGFEGGDIKGITQKIKEGYFNKLGINAIWMTPIVEQIHDGTDEGTGYTYGYHGYWTKDWTAIDPNFGTKEDLKELVTIAHKNGIRILLDAVINHTGPVTDKDSAWPDSWVRTTPQCTYKDYKSTVTCTLVKNLPDIKTESNENVALPPQLVEKWKNEGRYNQEMIELDAFFEKTGYPRAPRFYIMKWLSDYITDFGIDGYRVDTVKHTEENVWEEFEDVCENAFNDWKSNNPELVLDDNPFYLVGEIYFYNINSGKIYDFGDKKVNYFDDSFSAMINFDLRSSGEKSYEEVFSNYSNILNTNLDGYGTLNYLTSHDDGQPFDKERKKTYETATRLLLAPGASQVYYGDESARPLIIEGTNGDATLRSTMNWNAISSNSATKELLEHWQKLGKFRRDHPAVGAGTHQMISEKPYTFSRTWKKNNNEDKVIIGLNISKGEKIINVSEIFKNDEILFDAYSNKEVKVVNGKIKLNSDFEIVLLAKK